MANKDKLMALLNLMIEKYNLRSNFLVSGYIGVVQQNISDMEESDAAALVDGIKKIVNA